jgi:hypothetical protein
VCYTRHGAAHCCPAALTMGKGGSASGNLRIELEEILAAIHARRPRPSWAAAVAEIAQHEFSVRGGSTAKIFADPEGRGELETLLDDILAEAFDLGLWDDEWEADARDHSWHTASMAAVGSKKRAGGDDDGGDEEGGARAAKRRSLTQAAALSGNDDARGVQPAAAVASAAAQDDESEEDDDEEDWKATVFYWRGKLEVDAAKRRLCWGGAWVGGSSKRLPSSEEFASSPNTFALTAALGKGNKTPPTAQCCGWPLARCRLLSPPRSPTWMQMPPCRRSPQRRWTGRSCWTTIGWGQEFTTSKESRAASGAPTCWTRATAAACSPTRTNHTRSTSWMTRKTLMAWYMWRRRATRSLGASCPRGFSSGALRGINSSCG